MTPLPKPDTHCFDDDTQKDVWSHSTEQMLDYGKAERERALEEAVTTCESFDSCDPKYIAAAIRALKEKK